LIQPIILDAGFRNGVLKSAPFFVGYLSEAVADIRLSITQTLPRPVGKKDRPLQRRRR
jgi:hypothetical protein